MKLDVPEQPELIRKKTSNVMDGALQVRLSTIPTYECGASGTDKVEKGDRVHKQAHKIPSLFYIDGRFSIAIMGKNFKSAVNGKKERKIRLFARKLWSMHRKLKGSVQKWRCLMAETELVQKIYARLLAKLSKLIAEAEAELKEVQKNNHGI